MQFHATDAPLDAVDGLLAVAVTGTSRDDLAVSGGADGLDPDLVDGLRAVKVGTDVGSTARVPRPGGGSLLAVVVGPAEGLDERAVRRFGHEVGRAVSGEERVAVLLPGGVEAADASQALAEGVVLGAYRFATYKQELEPTALADVDVHGGADPDALATGEVVARCQTVARDLVNTPPNDKRPPALAARAVELGEAAGLAVEVLDGDALLAGGYGGLVAVGMGSAAGPQLVELRWEPDAAVGDHVALVGKGITFDTGGISLKPSASMATMKMDMGGAAAALATMLAVAELGLPVRATGILCLAENMPSGTAQRVSDVYTARDGTTVEVLNTDAEGRLVLADGIAHAAERGAEVVVDLATLTGAASVALGDRITLLLADDDELADQLLAAGTDSDEPSWRMPLGTEHFREQLDSDVADIKNVGGRKAGSITAGLFLHHFVPDAVRWAHMDIAGTAWADGARPLAAGTGATGVPVRTLVRWLATR